MEQIKLLTEYPCDSLYVEDELFESNKELSVLLDKVTDGDVIVVANLQTFGESVKKLTKTLDYLQTHNVRLVGLMDQLDTHKTYSFYRLFNIIAESEQQVKETKIKQKLEVRRANGEKIGRPQLDTKTINRIRQLHAQQKVTVREIASICHVSIGSVHKYIHSSYSS